MPRNWLKLGDRVRMKDGEILTVKSLEFREFVAVERRGRYIPKRDIVEVIDEDSNPSESSAMPENDAAERAADFIAVESTGGCDHDLIRDRIEHEQDAEGVAERIVSLHWCSANLSRAQWISVVTDLIRKGRTDG